ncbi:MAG TPA: MFS transporter [Gemmatimonadales bacterium]|nr:MFS transporter [Gemmatimonadales bacterium]
MRSQLGGGEGPGRAGSRTGALGESPSSPEHRASQGLDLPAPSHAGRGASPDRIPRTVKGLALVSLFNDFASEMVYPLLPAFITGSLGGSPATLGALDGAADLAAAVTKWGSGRLADRPRWRRPLILLGYFSAILVRPAMAVASAAWQVLSFRVLDRLGKGLRTPPRDALIADITPPAIRGRAFGFHRAADHFGSIPGSLLAWGLLSAAVDVRTVLGWSMVPGLLAGLVLLLVLRSGGPGVRALESDRAPAPPREATGTGPAAAPAAARLGPAVLALALLALCRLPEALLLLRLQDLGVAVRHVPLVWAGLHLVRTACSYPGGWLSDHWGNRPLVALGSLVFAAGVAGLGVPLGAGAAVAVFLGMGLVAGLTESAERSLVAALSPGGTGRGFGAYHALTGLAALPAALGFGVVYQRFGGGSACLTSALALTLAAMLWVALPQRARRRA